MAYSNELQPADGGTVRFLNSHIPFRNTPRH